MRFTVEAKDLAAVLRALGPVGQGSKVLPITSCVRIDAGKTVRFSATNGDHWMRTEIAAPGECSPGSCCVPLKALAQVAGSLSGRVTLAQESAKAPLEVTAGRARLKLSVQDPDDFPRPHGILDTTEDPTLVVDWPRLATVLSPVAFASQDDTRFVLNGVCVELSDGPAFAAATDGHRLDVRGVVGVEAKARAVVILHRDACAAIASGFQGEPEIRIHIKDGVARFADSRGTVLVTRLVDGKFPAWREVLPQKNATTARMEAPALLDAVRRVALLMDSHAPAVRLVVADGAITLSTSSAESGEATDAVDAGTEGPTLRIGVNARYLADALRGRVGSVEVAGNDELSPLLFTFADGARHVIMPMRC